MTSCGIIRQSAKYNFNDGEYQTRRFSKEKVYVLKVDDDTISVFPIIRYGDSSAVNTRQRVNYTTSQRKLKDNKTKHDFFRPSLDVDIMTIPLKYRLAAGELPNTLTTNFNGALFTGYRIDAYRLNYKRTPLNTYKQTVKHIGYSVGLFAGIGSSVIDNSSLSTGSFNSTYDGVLLITGLAANVAVDNITIGIAAGTDRLLDKHHEHWIYEGQPCIGFTLGLNIN
jgi:hypothetical protein